MEEIEIRQVKAWYQNPLLWIGLGVAGCLILLAMPHVTRAYHRWSGRRYLQRATQAYAKGSYQQAILNARGALDRDPKDVEAMRLMARTAEALGAPQALEFRRQLDALKPGDLENLLGMADAYLKAGDSTAATEVLKTIPPADRGSGRYHDLAAGIAADHRDVASAEEHWTEACRLEPKSDDYKLKFATLRLNTRKAGMRAASLAVVEELSSRPEMRLRALRVLLGDAMALGDAGRARVLADALVSEAQAGFADKLTRLSILRAGKAQVFSVLSAQRELIDPEFSSALAQMQESAASKPDEVFQLLTWMNEHNLALLAPDWVAKLPPEVISKPPVSLAVANAYARASDWKKLKESVENTTWQQMDFLRLAWLARSLERLDDLPGCRATWTKAVAAAEVRPESLEMLGKEVLKWGWENKTGEVLRKLAASERCPRWAVDYLWKDALKKGDTAELFKVSRLVLKAEPKSVPSRNNYISLALLTGQDPSMPWQLAETLYKENPNDPTVISTYGLALYQQGRSEEAVALMEMLSSEQLHVPTVALYYGIFLAAAGQVERAEEYLEAGTDAPLLPEEKALGDFHRYAVRSRALDRRGDSAGANASWSQAEAAAQANPDWLERLGRMAFAWGWKDKAETVILKLAAADRCPRWATDTLWTAALKAGDSAQITKASKLIQSVDPKNVQARNNFILVALLMGRDGDSPQRLAEALCKENQADALVVATQAFSLIQQGKAEDAVPLLAALKSEQLSQPQVAFYYGLSLAFAGHAEQATEYLEKGAPTLRFPEEKALLEMVRLACRSSILASGGDGNGAEAAWSQAIAVAQKRSDWLGLLASTALKGGAPQRAETALWKLADEPNCPLWAIDFLCAAAEKNRNSAQIYKASKLKSKADPRNVGARSWYVLLALLTGHAEDFPHRMAEGLAQEFPGNAQAAVAHGLSLYQRGRETEAVAMLGALKPAQLREPRPAFYYGLFLAATGQAAKAEEFLQIGTGAALLPEEQALLAKLKLAAGNGMPR